MSRPKSSSHLLGGLTASFSHGYVYPTGKERPRGNDCDLKASQVILDGAHESVG